MHVFNAHKFKCYYVKSNFNVKCTKNKFKYFYYILFCRVVVLKFVLPVRKNLRGERNKTILDKRAIMAGFVC